MRTWSPPPGSGQPDPRVRMLPGAPDTGPGPGWGAAADAVIGQAFEQVMGGLPVDLAVHTVVVPDAPGPVLVEYACRADDLLLLGSGGPSRCGAAGSPYHRSGRRHRLEGCKAGPPVV